MRVVYSSLLSVPPPPPLSLSVGRSQRVSDKGSVYFYGSIVCLAFPLPRPPSSVHRRQSAMATMAAAAARRWPNREPKEIVPFTMPRIELQLVVDQRGKRQKRDSPLVRTLILSYRRRLFCRSIEGMNMYLQFFATGRPQLTCHASSIRSNSKCRGGYCGFRRQ